MRNFNDKSRECHCTPPLIQRYVSKVSGPLLDRIDIHIQVPASNIASCVAEPPAKARPAFAPCAQSSRSSAPALLGRERKTYSHAQMGTRQIRTFCELGANAEKILERAMQQKGLTARAHHRILKVARNIADPEGQAQLTVSHIAEAIQYRTLDRSYWS